MSSTAHSVPHGPSPDAAGLERGLRTMSQQRLVGAGLLREGGLSRARTSDGMRHKGIGASHSRDASRFTLT